MRALLQRVTGASVQVEKQVVGRIGPGLVILLGIAQHDTEEDAAYLAEKVVHLRIFADDVGRFDRSLLDIQGQALVVSQFTLLADTRKGRRPSFFQAAPPERAELLIERFVQLLQDRGLQVASGRFGAMMLVTILNDGPVTVMLDSKE